MVELWVYSEDKTTFVNALDEEGRETEKYTHAHTESKINSQFWLSFSFLVCLFCFAFCSFEPLEDSHCCLTS